MKHKSKKKLLHEMISFAHNQDKITEVLHALLTPAEIQDLYDRMGILRSIHQGSTQRDVAKKEKVSISKVTRGAATYKKSKKLLALFFDAVSK